MDVFGEPRDCVLRDFGYERRLDLRAAQERLWLEGDLIKRILQNVG